MNHTNDGIDISDELLLDEHKRSRPNAVNKEYTHALLKKGIWVYFVLLIFEGALRKWVFPSLATPLLVVRDPVAMWLLYIAWRDNELPNNRYFYLIIIIAVIAMFTAISVGHGSIVVAVYGARILMFHFPLIFLIGKIFNHEDVVKIGKVVLWMSIPMAMLIVLQFYSPQSAYVNRGIGADSQGGGFSGALGYYRPPGTFSFTTGNAQFFGLVGVYVFYFWLTPHNITRLLLIASTISLIVAIPISISRGLFVQTVLTGFFALLSISGNAKYLGKFTIAGIGLLIFAALLSNVDFFQRAIEVLTSRFQSASDSEGSIQNSVISRIFAGINEPFEGKLPFFGYGIGMGTNAGAQLLVGRSDEFLIAEGEWGRLIGEMGAILGLLTIGIRIHLCLKMAYEAFKRIRINNLLPWMMLSVSFQAVAQGQWAQPTALGFGVLMGGLTIAAMRKPAPMEDLDEDDTELAEQVTMHN
ncbi:hypothetical protein [Mucilaginibacter segetis]|uniref:O-antigen ligase domain-containing protein n=1 Tax=Mucilaginibacter segetis TaxID=2793071 RepID=A0A934UND0_9SPHI|nr:hypothetical protein [Mucilaginibacter segetis]MBK0380663.1 hypothetical protein [Mucilaginibacter segetis]